MTDFAQRRHVLERVACEPAGGAVVHFNGVRYAEFLLSALVASVSVGHRLGSLQCFTPPRLASIETGRPLRSCSSGLPLDATHLERPQDAVAPRVL